MIDGIQILILLQIATIGIVILLLYRFSKVHKYKIEDMKLTRKWFFKKRNWSPGKNRGCFLFL